MQIYSKKHFCIKINVIVVYFPFVHRVRCNSQIIPTVALSLIDSQGCAGVTPMAFFQLLENTLNKSMRVH